MYQAANEVAAPRRRSRQRIAPDEDLVDLVAAQLVVQRPAPYVASTVNEMKNLARCFVDGKPVGDNVLNEAVRHTGVDVTSALVKPTGTTTAVVSVGCGTQINIVPTSSSSFHNAFLSPGSWCHHTTQAIFRAMHHNVRDCTGLGKATFRAFEAPTAAAMFKENRRHEDLHASDFAAAFKATT